MASLHQISDEIKFVLKWGGILVGIFTVGVILLRVGNTIKEYISPTPPSPPTVTFGKLPKVSFVDSSLLVNPTFTIDTTTGKLPTFPDRAKVFTVKKIEPTLLAFETAQKNVTRLGFTTKGTAITEVLYQWNEPLEPLRTLKLNIVTYNFDVTSNFYSNSSVTSAQGLPDEKEATEIVNRFLNDLGNSPEDIDTEKTKTKLYSIRGQELIPSTSFSNTQIISIDLYQKDIDGLPVYYSSPTTSAMRFLVGGIKTKGEVVEANFFHNVVNDESATYPLKTADEAFEELKSGKGAIVSYSGADSHISIKKVFLAYYADNKEQDFFMPIIVFEGENDFYAYISAIKDEWTQSN